MNLEALTALASTIYGFIKPVITSEVGKEITDDFKDATKGTMRELWQKIKPLFIIDDKESEELQDLKKDPQNPINEDLFLAKLRAKLSKHENLRKDVATIIDELSKSDDPAVGIIIQNSKLKGVNFGNISGVQGSVHFGDNYSKPPKP